MIRTDNILNSLRKDIPIEWIYEYYLDLKEQLTGQRVNIKSIFNDQDKNPSMYIYLGNQGVYRWKDFSSGNSGDAIELVKHLFNLGSREKAIEKINYDFSQLDNIDSIRKPIETNTLNSELKKIDIREWNDKDKWYWSRYHISKDELERYNIKPIRSFEILKNGKTLILESNNIYGYFCKDGIYKIYQPLNKEHKFMKLKNYIQGSEQLVYKPYLVINSSLKDLLAFNALGFEDCESIAPDSENTMLKPQLIEYLKTKYKAIVTMLDNDTCGKQSMKKYLNTYNISGVLINCEKDVADRVLTHGIETTKEITKYKLYKALNNENKKIY